MKKKTYTRNTPRLFTDLRKQACPLGHFQSEDDLFHAFVDWLDYYDPIGMVRNWGLRREYEPEAADLSLNVRHCRNADEFAEELRRCLTTWFDELDLKPHFLRHGFQRVAQDGWVLWRRFQFDMQQQAAWLDLRQRLARFSNPTYDGRDRLIFHRLLRVDGVDCLFQMRLRSGGRLEFVAADVADWTDAKLIERAMTTGLIGDNSDRHVCRDDQGLVSVVFGQARSSYPQRS